MRSDVIELINKTYVKDTLGQLNATESKRTVFAYVSSVTSKEFFEGGQNGLRPQWQFRVFRGDYNGETDCEYNGNRYSVYRTYERGDSIELYVQLKGGDGLVKD